MSDPNLDLWKAIRKRSLSKAQEALDQGADPNFRKQQGLSVLMYAVWMNQTEIVKLLCEKGADVNYQHPLTHDTALLMAVPGGQIEIVKTLCQYGANKQLQTIDGKTAMDYIEEGDVFSQIEEILETCGVTDPSGVAPPVSNLNQSVQDPAVIFSPNEDPQGGRRRKTRKRKHKRKSTSRKSSSRSRKY
jgi:hypothetical protein